MTAVVVLLGPATVRGPCPVRPELVRAGLGFLDDRDTILDDRPVPVDSVLSEVIATSAGEHNTSVVLVCPGWWPAARLDRIRAAASSVFAEVVVLQRSLVHRRECPGVDVLIEISDEFVIAGTPETTLCAVPRHAGMAAAVVSGVGEPASVLIDVPGGVRGARAAAAEIGAGLRRRGAEVEIVGDRQLLRAAGPRGEPAATPARRLPRLVAAGVVAAVAAGALMLPREERPGSTVLMTEARVAATVPAGWMVERITAGTGSRRVQVTEPGGGRAVLIVQSRGEADMAATAATLDTALQREDPKVFTDLQTTAVRAGRTVISYTEIRQGRQIDWAVFLDGGVRIAIGCQSASEQDIRAICEQAVASAHAVP